VGANQGITWLSEGAWREDWWTLTDALIDSHRSWIKEDSQAEDLAIAIQDFKRGWNAIAETDEERFNVLQPLYATDLKTELFVVDLPEAYHTYHKKWHPVYNKAMLDRGYYDVFIFDLKGNMIYSVYKEPDYATNFGTTKSTDKKFTEWQGSGLGDAFRGAMAAPDEVTLTPWTPYGPSAGALASFLAITVRDSTTAAQSLVGVFSTQMPPEALSIENVEEDCTLEKIAESFAGSINFAGLGKPVAEEMDSQVPCFKGKTGKALLEVLDSYLSTGYPAGNEANKVQIPYMDVRSHSVDGACVFAYAVQYLLAEGYSLYEIEAHTEEVYADFIDYLKIGMRPFKGASGLVKFEGNEKPAYLAVQQVLAGTKTVVGTCSHNSSIDLSINGGPDNSSWKPAHPDQIPPEADFPYFAFQVFLPVLCICCPALAACIRNY
jgi:hypothetical protein